MQFSNTNAEIAIDRMAQLKTGLTLFWNFWKHGNVSEFG